MNAENLMFDPTALAAPKTIDDLIALAKEIRAEFAVIHAHMDGILMDGMLTKRDQLTTA